MLLLSAAATNALITITFSIIEQYLSFHKPNFISGITVLFCMEPMLSSSPSSSSLSSSSSSSSFFHIFFLDIVFHFLLFAEEASDWFQHFLNR